MTDTVQRIIELLEEKGISAGALALKAGVSRDAIYKILRRERVAKLETLKKIADGLNVPLSHVLGDDEIDKQGSNMGSILPEEQTTSLRQLWDTYDIGPVVLLPVYEEAAAGAPCFVDERPVDRQAVDATRVQHDLPNYILVRVAGDSMRDEGIMPGGMVLVHRQEDVDDGQVAVVRIKSDGVTIKRVRHIDGGRQIMLIPRNATMREQIYNTEDIAICGRVVQAITDID